MRTNLNKMNIKDRERFREFVNTETKFNPHIMVISKKKRFLLMIMMSMIMVMVS